MNIFDLPIKIESIVYHIDDNGVKNFLAIKRSPEDGGFWQPVTGTLESVENIQECIVREISEEIGLNKEDIISISDCIYQFKWHKDSVGEIYEYVFAVEVRASSEIKLSGEHTEYKWGIKEVIRNVYEMSDNKIAIDKV